MKNCALPLPMLLLCVGIAAACPARAQQNPTAPGGVTLQHATDNGYDDLIAACEAIADKTSRAESSPGPPPSVFDRVQQPDATLADKRVAVRDPRFRLATTLLRAALTKPALNPPIQAHSERVTMLGSFLSLIHLLPILLYVQLADGSTASALDTLEQQIALGDAMQHWDYLFTLVGQSVIALGVNPISTHLDRLSAGDCARLFDLLRAELNAPNPAIDGLYAESGRVADLQRALKTLGDGIENTSPTAAGVDKETEIVAYGLNAAEAKEVGLLQRQKGAALSTFTENITARMISLNEAAITANLDPSALAPTKISIQNRTDALAEKMAGYFAPKTGTVSLALDHAAVSRATLQLLAIGAAISRYRWEHNALPDSLDALKIGALAKDPFTQGMVAYIRSPDGKQYTLSCAGPLPRDGNYNVLSNGKRKPVTLP